MKKLFILCLVSLFFFFNAYAHFVPKEDAKTVAKNHFYQAVNSLNSIDYYVNIKDIKMSCILNPEKDNSSLFYIFNVNNNNGYVLVSSSKKITPILAYSLQDGFNVGNIAPSQQLFLDYYNQSIQMAFDNKLNQEQSTLAAWEELLNFDITKGFNEKQTVEPLLGQITWDQTWPYNAHHPEDDQAMGGRVPVGCVATAMLQVMKYYNWPETGEGSRTHSSWLNGGYGTYEVDFSAQTYDWYSIPNSGSRYNYELAEINLHAAVSVRMWWGPNGSGSQTDRVVTALRDHFKYDPGLSLKHRSYYSDEDWATVLREQIDNKTPMVYSGAPASGGAGHAWNCDGYQDDRFHMNWGWGGAGNGFYTLDNLHSSAVPGGVDYNFIAQNQIVVDIYPRDNYPVYCGGITRLTGMEGAFEDGSSSSEYMQNTNCTFVIDPECGAIVNLRFDSFDLADGDYIELYDGNENSENLIKVLDKQNPPDATFIRSTTGALTIRFRTDGNTTAQGWKASYNVTFCRSNISITDAQGSFDDGSGTCEYETSTVCSWIIQPEGNVNYITLDFEEFDLGAMSHFVRVYKSSINSANEIVTLTSATPPSEPIIVEAPAAAIQFFASTGNVGQGWKINYTSGYDGESNISDISFIESIALIPNPGNENTNIVLLAQESEIINISIYNILGVNIGSIEYQVSPGENTIALNQLASNLRSGVYLINISFENELYTEKLIVLD